MIRLLLSAALLPGLALAAGIDCRRAATRGEQLICARADLRAADAQLAMLYTRLSHAATPEVRARLRGAQLRWLAARDRDCTDAPCLRERMAARIEQFTALAARLSDSNPTLFDLRAIWLTGVWTPGAAGPARFGPPMNLPDAGIPITLRAGSLCTKNTCGHFGLEPAASGSDAYIVSLDSGKADYTLSPAPHAVVAHDLACPPGAAASACGTVTQTWAPAPGAGLRDQDLAAGEP